jgi:hypothetical protein
MLQQFTYPIALGPSGVPHNKVEKRFSDELNQLSDPTRGDNRFYSKIHGRDIRVHAVLMCSLMDQPERRGTNYMVGGNGLYGARWGYSINLQEIKDRLVPCIACHKKIIARDLSWDKTDCSECAQWNMDRPQDDDFLNWKSPKGFPEGPNLKNGHLHPRKLSYDILCYAAGHTHARIVAGQWTKAEAELFMSYYCLSGKAQVEILRHAQNLRAFDNLSTVDDQSEEYQALLERRRQHPHEFEQWSFPTFWKRRLGLEGVIDVPMHLVFLGAVENITGFVHSWLRKHEKFSNFMRLAENRLNDMVKFGLSWLKILPYKGDGLGGWVSENFVGFSRISKWFYLILDSVKEDKEPYQDPEAPQNSWTAVQNRAWLKARGLPSDGKAAALKERVAAYLLANTDIPLLPPPGGTMEDLHLLVDSMYEMVKSIMVFEVNDDVVRMADSCRLREKDQSHGKSSVLGIVLHLSMLAQYTGQHEGVRSHEKPLGRRGSR